MSSFLPGLSFRNLRDFPVKADPAVPFLAMPERFFSGWVTLAAALPALAFCQLKHLAIAAAPAQIFAMPARFLRRRVTGKVSRLRLGLSDLHNLPVKTDPAGFRSTVPARLFLGAVALALPLLTFCL